jgi:hypothetical protein
MRVGGGVDVLRSTDFLHSCSRVGGGGVDVLGGSVDDLVLHMR